MPRTRITQRLANRQPTARETLLAEITDVERLIDAMETELEKDGAAAISDEKSVTGYGGEMGGGSAADTQLKSETDSLMSDEPDWSDPADDVLQSDANAISTEDREIALDSTGVVTDDEGDQNAKMQNNWPISASRLAVAERLVRIAKHVGEGKGELSEAEKLVVAKILVKSSKMLD